MRLLPAAKAKFKIALRRVACGLREHGLAQSDQAMRQQGRDLGSALLGRQPLGWDRVGWVHRLSLLNIKRT
jgi:hypothetical protein